MNLKLNDVLLRRYLFQPVVVLLSLVVLTGLIDGAIKLEEETLIREERMKETQLRNIVSKISFLQYHEKLFNQYGSKYNELIHFGLANEQDRVKWTDVLLSLKEELVLSPFTIQFEPEQKIQATDVSVIKLKNEIFYTTRLNLELGLHSDFDLLRLFGEVSRKISPLFLVKRCEVSAKMDRLQTLKFDETAPIFDAICSISFFESKPRKFEAR